MMQTAESLTQEINQKFNTQFSDQFIAVLIAGVNELTLVIQLNKAPYSGGSYNPFPNYNKEPTLYGKFLKVLVNLEEACKFYSFLQANRIKNILVTTAPNANLVNNNNKCASEVETSKQIVLGLLEIKRKDEALFAQTFKNVTGKL
jgi:hypothetical protein